MVQADRLLAVRSAGGDRMILLPLVKLVRPRFSST